MEAALERARPLLARMFEPVENPTEAMRILCRGSQPELGGYWTAKRLFPLLSVSDLFLVDEGHIYATLEAATPEDVHSRGRPNRGVVVPSTLRVWTLAWGPTRELQKFRPIRVPREADVGRALPLLEDRSVALSRSTRLWRVGYTVLLAQDVDADAIEAMVDATKELAARVTRSSAHPRYFR